VLLVSHDRALLDAVSGRLLAIEDRKVVSYDGGWADYVRAQEADDAPAPEPKPAKPRRERPRKPQPSPIELVEAEVARAEERVAELERRLAEDWSDVDLLASHRTARDDLAALLERWEALFEESSRSG
jgi:ATPase subunit of ABC transporter with duplicated ATPase domains